MPRNMFSTVGKVITDHEKVISDIKAKRNLKDYFIENNMIILICGLIFGAVLGVFVGGEQIIINSIKIPLLFFITLYISLPIFYIIDLLTGSKIDFVQIATLILTGYAVAAIILMTFIPVVLFFIVTAKEYYFTVFLTIGVTGLAGYFSIVYIWRNFQVFHDDSKWYPSVITGTFIIAFVGTQLAWSLRPFFHPYSEFIRPMGGNFYSAIAKVAAQEPAIAGAIFSVFALIALVVTIVFIDKMKSERMREWYELNKKINEKQTQSQAQS